MPDDNETDRHLKSEDETTSGDAGSRESRERVQRGGEPDTDEFGNADGAS